MTTMVYGNVDFDSRGIFFNLPITHIEPPLTKKQKHVDKKKIQADYGAIVNVQYGTMFRGIEIQKKKKKSLA
jgi:hypothetical protein